MADGFTQRCYAWCRKIPRGKVATYGQLARAAGSPGAARAVGNAMRNNPDAPATPCHRVVGSDGKLTGYAYGLPRKIEFLTAEGVAVVDGRVDLKRFGFRWPSGETAREPQMDADKRS